MKFSGIDINGQLLVIADALSLTDLSLYRDIVQYIEGEPPTHDYYWDNAWVPIPISPNPNYTLNWVTKVWEDTRLLADVKAAQKLAINLARAAANQTSFTYLGKEIAVDQLSRSDIEGTNGYITANNTFPYGWPDGWKAMDNSFVTIMDVATWKEFYAAMVNQGTANFLKAQSLKTAIDVATTIPEVEAIVW
jgi:hypothetical protein